MFLIFDIVRANERLNPQCSTESYHTTPQSTTQGSQATTSCAYFESCTDCI